MTFSAETQLARAAQASWAALSLRQRLQPVRQIRRWLVERRDELTQAMLQDVDRPPAETLATDILPSASACKYLLTEAPKILRDRYARRTPLWLYEPFASQVVVRRPHGVVGIIGTWNYPLFLNLVPILHATTAGNAVLWKPSEQTTALASVLSRWLQQAEFPTGLIHTLPTTRDAGPQLLESDLDFLHFTGSETVGRQIARRLGERLIPSVLELSGVDACIVLPDADLDLAARSIWYALTLNRGQTCLAVRRILVHADAEAGLIERLRAWAAQGKPLKLQTTGQLTQAERLLAQAMPRPVVTTPGEAPPGTIRPTILLQATPDLALCQEALFAPLAALMTFRTPDELIQLHEASGFGLGCAIFTEGDSLDGRNYVHRLRVGLVHGNDVIVGSAHPSTPLTARGRSGWGATQGDEGLLAMTVPQTIAPRESLSRPHLDAGLHPHEADQDLMTGLLRFTHAPGWLERFSGLLQMLRAGFRARNRASATPKTDTQ